MKFARIIAVSLMLAHSLPVIPQEHERRVYLCRSPLLAFDFWNKLQDLRRQGITITKEIDQQVCDHMKAGADPQCIYVEVAKFKPIASGWGGALALTDGTTKYWFHNPDDGGWVHPEYYVYLMNSDK